MKIFVIGSMINSKEIEDFNCAIHEVFDNIEWCDRVYVVRKNNGEIGHGTTYEIEYARRLGKEIYYLN